MKKLAMMISVVGMILGGSRAAMAGFPIDPGAVQNITNTSDYYEREADLLKASNGTWYLIYAKSRTPFTAGDNKDDYSYDAYVRTSGNSGQTWSAETIVLDGASAGGNFRGPKIVEADGNIWALASDLGSNVYANTYSGGIWSGQSMVHAGSYSNGFFHIDPVVEGDNIRLFGGISNESLGVGYIMYDGSTDTWGTTVIQVGASAGHQIPDVAKEGGTYYMVSTKWSHILFTSTTTPDTVTWPAGVEIAASDPAFNPNTWADGVADPAILKYGDTDGSDDLIVFYAPWHADGSQNLRFLYSTDAGATWSSSIAFTDGSQGPSDDFMPLAHMLDPDTIQVIFNMEARGGDSLQGDIVSYDLAVSAVPEPGTMVLLAIGGIGALIRRRRRRV